ncbi:MAG: hypothetical protein ACRET4_16340, partial [Steroidobacteraceae bacterium]
MIAGVSVLSSGGLQDRLAALIASSAELSTLGRNIRHLSSLLRQGDVRPALEYRAMLDTLAGDVRGHPRAHRGHCRAARASGDVKVTGGRRGMKAIAAHFRISKNGRLDSNHSLHPVLSFGAEARRSRLESSRTNAD